MSRASVLDHAAAPPVAAALWVPHLDRAAAVPPSRQLAAALRAAVVDGTFGAGARLPSTRSLAAELGLARSTVVAVFEQLAAEGYIAGRQGSGYFVAKPLALPPAANVDAARAMARPRPLSRGGERLRDLLPPRRAAPQPFDLGQVEIDGRFVAIWKRLAARALSGRSRLEWQYGDPQGEPALRRAIALYLGAARGARCRPEQVVLTSGTTQGLSLLARILLDPGDTALVEDPCYRAALDILRAAEAKIVPVPVDGGGFDTGAAPKPINGAARLVYTTPSRQYPLGMAMPLWRRAELLKWAEAAGAWIVEDDYESEFQPPARTLPSLQGLDRAGRVIYLGTFSKVLFPSLRLGYAVLPDDLIAPFVAARHLADRQSPALPQQILTDFMLDGHFARHLRRMRVAYAGRQQFLTEMLERRLGGLVEVRPVECGMYLTAWLPPDMSDRAAAAALAKAGIVTLPLSALTIAAPRPPALVLGYTGHGATAMARAVERMETVLARTTGLKN